MASYNISLNTTAPYSFNEWAQFATAATSQVTVDSYSNYIKDWYQSNNKANLLSVDIIKQDYINLLKELTYFFTEEEKNLFIKDIDFNNDIEIIYAIPFFVKKLKEIALTISKKRTILKNNKNKYKSLGSNRGIEKLLYEYLLTSHTKSIYSTQISISSLGVKFPELSAVRDMFSIEIENIYDPDPYFSVENNTTSLTNIKRITNNNLFNILQGFLETDTQSLSSYSSYTTSSPLNVSNIFNLNEKYLGNTIYGLTAVKYDNTAPDAFANLSFTIGNNWFYWPSGETFTDLNIISNIYVPISLNSSVFKLSGTGGSSYLDSDLFFTESRGIIKGAWLKSSNTKALSGTMVVTAQPEEIRSFIYPTPGYGLTNNLVWTGRVLDDEALTVFNLLDSQIKTDIIKKYFTTKTNNYNVSATYINKTNLVYSSAHAGNISLNSDSILVRPGGPFNDINQTTPQGVYNDTNITQEAFLYKLTSTEIVIDNTDNYILWPIISYTQKIPDNILSSINITSDTCNDIYLGNINTNEFMIGAVAGLDIDTSDIIAKLPNNSTDSTPLEVAWFCGGSIKDLATYNSYSIPVYDIPAVNCTTPANGPIQSSLSLTCASNNRVSFIWCDKDTPADEVFRFHEHTAECKYSNTSHNYESYPADYWSNCSCKSVYYSPIGHIGDQLGDYNSSADILFADPQDLGSKFTLTNWRDTRNFNYKTSPQFAFFKKNTTTSDLNVGWGPGSWKTGNNSKMILKTGRRYTYMRSGFRSLAEEFVVPSFNVKYPYKKIISSVQSDQKADTVIAIDISGSQYYSINKTKQLAKRIVELTNTNNGSQVAVVVFDSTSVTASYLSKNKQALIDIIEEINIKDTTAPSNLKSGLDISLKLLQNIFGANQLSLSVLCSNLNVAINTPFAQIRENNIPNTNNTKNIILISDGEENINKNLALQTASIIKAAGIKLLSVDIGPNSISNNLMERLASELENYWNFEQALIQEDTENTIDQIASSIIAKICGTFASQPVWKKAILDGAGGIIGLNEISDMSLKPGDILRYTKRTEVSYDTFTTITDPFIINIPLFGWNYETHQYDGMSRGAKPYWGKVYNYPADKFNKFGREIGGHITFYNNYLPISHPEPSTLTISTNDYVEYRNRGCKTLIWQEDLFYTETAEEKEWMKLRLCVQEPTLKDIFKNNSIDKIFEQTYETSDIEIGTYTDYTPAYYCYYTRESKNLSQPLFRRDKQNISYSQITTGIAIEPANPYANLNNTHYALIAAQPNVSAFLTKEEVGHYLLPHNLGVPYYLGYGYTNTLDLSKLQTLSASEVLFLDPQKYTSNRGLTKQDQPSPFVTTFVDNSWLKESYSSGKKAGNIVNAVDYQKFVPYQSNYESAKFNIYGLSRQDDQFEFWSGSDYITWNNTKQYPLNYKKEPYKLQERTESLLVTDKNLTNWQTDIYGNNYGLYKNNDELSLNKTQTLTGELWVRDVNNNIKPLNIALSSVINNYINNTAHFNYLTSNQIIDYCVTGDTILLQTPAGVNIDKIFFNIETSTYE